MNTAILNTPLLYILCGSILAWVVAMCIFFLVRAWKAGKAMGIPVSSMKKVITSSVTFTMIPSVAILLGVVALSGTLGIPLPWLRLSVIGALHYETSVADIAARSLGLSGLSASEMTLQAFTTIALLMSAGIIWGLLATLLFNKPYLKHLNKVQKQKTSDRPSFANSAMTAMFIGLVACYAGSYFGVFSDTGNFMPLVVLCSAAGAMALFTWAIEKKQMRWLESFSIAGSMLFAMAVAVVLGLVL